MVLVYLNLNDRAISIIYKITIIIILYKSKELYIIVKKALYINTNK